MDRFDGVIRDFREPAVQVCHGYFVGEHRAIHGLAANALPDHVIGLDVSDLEVVLFLAQRLRKPGIIAPGNLLHHRVGRRGDHKPLIGLIRLKFWVKGDPDFAAVLTNGWDQHIPRGFGNSLCFLNPTDIHTFKGFDIGDVVFQPDKKEFRTILTAV